MDQRELIRRLGGPTAVAADLGLRTQAVGNWVMRGSVPREHHLAVWSLALRQGVDWRPPLAEAEDLLLVPSPERAV